MYIQADAAFSLGRCGGHFNGSIHTSKANASTAVDALISGVELKKISCSIEKFQAIERHSDPSRASLFKSTLPIQSSDL